MNSSNEIQANKYYNETNQNNTKKLEGKINNGFESYIKLNREGSHIAGLYDFEGTIGQGHFAVVKLARHIFSGEKVAIKVIDKNKLDEISREHLFQEVKCMKLVQHQNVVRLYEVIDTDSKLYLILELGDGGDMYDYIMKHSNGLSEQKSKSYFRQIVNAVKYCHDLHVVHRDLKPENVVFFERTGQVKLTDFGFSNIFVPGNKLYTSCGSLAYSAPEILLGDSYDAPSVDVWSLGVILYMLATGRAPFQEANDSETLTMILDCKYYLPPHLSLECSDLISRILVRDPEKRIKLDDISNHSWLREFSNDEQINGYLSDCSYGEKQLDECDEKDDDYADDDADDDDNEELVEKSKGCLTDKHNNNNNKENQISAKRKKQINKIYKQLPLIKRENLNEKDHVFILDQMLIGKVAPSKEEIIKDLDEDKYNYITATYYLLAEKILRKHYMKRNKRKLGSNFHENPFKPQSFNGESLNQHLLNTNELFTYQTKPVKNLSSKTNYAKSLRNKLVRQEQAENEQEEQNDRASLIINPKKLDETKLQEKTDEIVIVAQTQLTNILEDEEEDVLFKNESNNLTMINSSNAVISTSRRSSRGGENTNIISNLTILEEVEAEDFTLDNFNTTNLNNNKSNSSNKMKLFSRTSNESLTRFLNEEKINELINEENEKIYDFDAKIIELTNTESNLNSKNKIKLFASRIPSSGADTSSDASDNELKSMPFSREIKDYDWNRSASSSSRSRSKSARQSNLAVLNGSQNQSRPLSISSETNKEDTISLKNEATNNFNLRTKSLAEEGNFNVLSSLAYLNQNKQFLSVSNSNDHLSQNNFTMMSKSLSVEHRMANISQMSISSQLSKNNSLRFPNRSGACDTPIQYVQPSTTPTPRESIVFNRGDEKPIAKILLGQSHQLKSQNSADYTNVINQLSVQHNSVSSVGSSPRSSIKSESKNIPIVNQESNQFSLDQKNELEHLQQANDAAQLKIAQSKDVSNYLYESINNRLKTSHEEKESKSSSKSLDSMCSLSQETLTINSNKSMHKNNEINMNNNTPVFLKFSEVNSHNNTNIFEDKIAQQNEKLSKKSSTFNLADEKVKRNGLFMTNTCTKCCNIL